MVAGAADCPAPTGRSAGDAIDDDGGDRLLGALGDSKCWPPGFRFHPTDEELIVYYLKRKVCRRRIRLPMIGALDVYKWEPWELPERSVLRSGDKQWYFFSPRDRKYPNGSRSNRTTLCGYWKATGKDRTISQNSRPAGNKKTLVYHQGRAPKGQRTDWVMYEYTLDEQMLANCKNVQDSYALCKVFRKSGPGPKNGEEYGAPFREEEWNDDNDEAEDSLAIQDERVALGTDHSQGASTATMLCNNDTDTPLDGDLEDLLRQMSSEEVVIPRHYQLAAYVSEVDVESEFGSHVVGPSYGDSIITKQSGGGWCEQDSIGTSFHISQSANVYTQPIETPEVTSLSDSYELGHAIADEEFLEIKDFNDWGMDSINQEENIRATNEFYDPYEYFDPATILAEALGSLDEVETQTQEAHINSVLWTHEQSFYVPAPLETEEIIISPSTSGVVCDNSLSVLGGDSRGEIINHAGSTSESWFSAALSALLDTVPSPPAIASESALISRALERVSSFKTGHIGAQGRNSTGDEVAAVRRRQAGGNGGLLFISFLVGLGAILWVLSIGVVVKIFKSMWERFVTS